MKTQKCARCGAVLAEWEANACACAGPRSRTHREILYAIACTAEGVLHARDFVRNAERDHRMHLGIGTAVTMLATDWRFCWAGKGLYGLHRHGPLPGARNLEQVARILLIAAGGPLGRDVVDYCLKQLGYRYNVGSLRNAVARSCNISWGSYSEWDHARGDRAELELRSQIPVVPTRRRAAWIKLREETSTQIRAAISQRAAHVVGLVNPNRFGMNWED